MTGGRIEFPYPGDRSVERRHQVLIVGGGTAGITVAARLLNRDPGLDVAIVEPSERHYYQPLWTLVGGGIYRPEDSERDEADLIPAGASWIKDAVTEFDPEANRLRTRDGRTLGYDFLVVAPGLKLDWEKVKGLRDAVGHDGVCSNYAISTVASTWETIRNFRGGTAIFTQPSGAVKCGGAPQKIMYLADEAFRRNGVRDRSRIVFASATGRIFAVEPYASALEKVVARKGIETRFQHELTELRPASKEAVFRKVDSGDEAVLRYDMIHVTPPMGAPDFVARSPLANAEGWVDVDMHTLRHVRYPNVFGLGDASSLPTSKTGAAIRKQAPTVVENVLAALRHEAPSARYDGYTSCPVVTGYNSLILAEFDYDKKPAETFPFDQSHRESRK
ncbi:NAD(P)/FAD-dependent oxidoreductase [Tautonia sociabilis]|uniref:NAD(P)/FAD-dependent oxidoreductase n=1 Tax=Tautonia sociabilis TaxID=2080755 RepID=A0A432MG57_9BACT|nr:NAD(P)/FAD-dependent oxidoreductase [Tautonia sociabilis]